MSKKELKTRFISKGINCPENSLLIGTLDYISRCIAELGPMFRKEFSAKSNFLLRGYYNKKERQAEKARQDSIKMKEENLKKKVK